MPKVTITAKKFNAWPPTAKTQSGNDYKKDIDVSQKDLARAAAEVGASSVVFGSPQRSKTEIAWRVNMTLANLSPIRTPNSWKKSNAYSRLDPSEKGSVSYFLGMVLPQVVAQKCWNVPHLVHVDAVLQILGITLGNVKRPDLLGYCLPAGYVSGHSTQPLARLCIEAKGRTNGYAQAPVDSALTQLASTPPRVLSLLGNSAPMIASLAHFEDDKWQGYMIDPPISANDAEYSDQEFQALIDTAYYWPFFEIIKEFSQNRIDDSNSEFIGVSFPEDNLEISIPKEIYEILTEITLPVQPPTLLQQWEYFYSNLDGSHQDFAVEIKYLSLEQTDQAEQTD